MITTKALLSNGEGFNLPLLLLPKAEKAEHTIFVLWRRPMKKRLNILILLLIFSILSSCTLSAPREDSNDIDLSWISIKRTRFVDIEGRIQGWSYDDYWEAYQSGNFEGYNDVDIYYPQFNFAASKKKIANDSLNNLIEYDVKKSFLSGNFEELFRKNNLTFYLDYDKIFINENMISIFYKGYKGATWRAYRTYPWAQGTTINLETAEIVTLTDIVTDPEALYGMLLEGRFEAISRWENIIGGYSIDKSHSGISKDKFLDAFNPENPYHYLEWYIDGENFVLVVLNTEYYEYSINLKEVELIVNLVA